MDRHHSTGERRRLGRRRGLDPGADRGWIVESADSQLVLSEDAGGVITLADGSEITFEGIERIDW